MHIAFEEYYIAINPMKETLKEVGASLDIAGLKKEIELLEDKMQQGDFWNDIENAQRVVQKSKALKDKVERYEKLLSRVEDLQVLIEISDEAEDLSTLDEIKAEKEDIEKKIEELRIETLLSGEYDKNNAIITIHAGAGGTEACDWASMLLRMYTRWASAKGYTVNTLDYLPGDEAGVKSVTLEITGEYAYGYLKSEKGVHRLVRISPFDAAGKRHTSFASLEVLPEITPEQDIEIRAEDLKIDTYRSGGAGGQYVNKTESAIRITHIPTGIIVQCQNERSQHANREAAMKMLKSKLIELKERAHKEKIEDLTGELKDIGWGSQIRSYVFQPYTMVKDHRTGIEVGNIQAVMDGEIDEFINAYLKWQAAGGN
ncbi:peptide chain release factor 2 [Caloramator sp. E03]|uniref:peptide chain release factor 2 n=1 Tax=Caloramator sp. E03 TaxID=2576307 RepID=UPI001110F4F0|nr:peptide chain release factor 2 [Caloramator sp. E03]QCX33930.1 peptide chain release factor 2 [Caloramator sp. E03]